MPKMCQLSLFLLGALCGLVYGNVELTDFMPYGPDHGDTDLAKTDHFGDLDDGSSPLINLTEPFQFFAQLHHGLWVNINGGVSFNRAIEKYTPTCEALEHDMSMISPFWADVDIRRRGTVYYRETTDRLVLDKSRGDVLAAFPNIADKDTELGIMKWALVATWVDVPFYDDLFCMSDLSNTFQLTLATDGIYSFAIFYYNRIEWTTGTASGGEGCTGKGGNPARAGFDNGKGIMSVLGGSCNGDILGVSGRTMGLTPGKFVFRVDDTKIIAPGSSTLAVITNTADLTTEPATEPTRQDTTSSNKDWESHLNTTKHDLSDLQKKCAELCPGLIDHPALQDECFDEWKKLDNLIDELKFTKTNDELYQIDNEANRIAMILHQIEVDIGKAHSDQ